MKKKLAIIAGSWVILTAGAAQAANAPYFSLAAGSAWLSSAILTDGSRSSDASFDTGYGLTAAVGYSFDAGRDAVRAELELGYR